MENIMLKRNKRLLSISRQLLIVGIALLSISGRSTRAGITYKPLIPMWDTWIFQDGDDYHLFFLSKENIGRAVSKDLIHWKTLPAINNMAVKGDWDEQGMVKTGCTIKHGDTYYLSYGSGKGSPVGFLISNDLMHRNVSFGRAVLEFCNDNE